MTSVDPLIYRGPRHMVFWRNKSAKKADTPVVVESEKTEAPAAEEPPPSNVVTLMTSRLADRLADVDAAPENEILDAIRPSEAIKPADGPHPFGQERAVAKIRAALQAKAGQHLLILGEPGTGRLDLARTLASETSRESADDWIYIVERSAPSRARAYTLPSGEKSRFVRDVREALDKAGAAFERHLRSDQHRISLDLLEEEMRERGASPVEQLRRRAEAQNIALVKSLDGYVLAPMHDGRVVRSDVFRALPEALKRNVEAKITTLEEELQAVVATIPDVEYEACEKYDALIRQTALRAIRPCLAPLKKSYADVSAAVAALITIEEAFLAGAQRGLASGTLAPLAVLDCELFDAADPTAPHRVVTATSASAADLVGEIGHDGAGRPALIPGQLMRAGSGFIILDAWKLAADPQAWLALSAAMESKEITPRSAHGVAIKADPIPLAATVVLIADDQSWSKLEAIEPGVARHFAHVVKLAATVPLADLGEDGFARGVARLAADRGLKPLDTGITPVIYKDAVRRGGGRVSIAAIPLTQTLDEANAIAGADSAERIRANHLEEALARRADGAVA
jgi:predicted ATP-dependent protease